jgi:peptidoglycan/xylan/chitin deacetylase (PgdA/CDA1 family)
MQLGNEILQSAYYFGTLPARWGIAYRLAQQQRSPLIILFYHRVADWPLNPWTMTRSMFRRQIEWLARRFELISLDHMLGLLADGQNDRPRLHISFDDGYRDNCDYALPLLYERQIPYTYFVASSHIIEDLPFPHDVQHGEPLAPNTVDQLRWIIDHGGTVGSHTRHHVDCGPGVSQQVLNQEIAGSKRDLEQLLGIEVDYFAFPYGQPRNLSHWAMQVAADAGYRAVCSAFGGYNLPGCTDLHLRRIHGDPLFSRLKNWITLDPRKLYWPRPTLSYPPQEVPMQEAIV